MRILHIINQLGFAGGAEAQLAKLTHAVPASHHIHWLYEHGTTAPQGYFNATLHPPNQQRDPENFSLPPAVGEAQGVVDQVKPHVIHGSLDTAGAVARRLDGAPIVESLVNIPAMPIRKIDNPNVTGPKLLFHRLKTSWDHRRFPADLYHAISPYVSDTWQNLPQLSRAPFTVVPRIVKKPPLVQDLSKGAARRELRLPVGEKTVVSVGRHEAQKGHLRALRSLPRDSQLHWHIVGREGNMTPLLRSEIEERGLHDIVTLHGPRQDVDAWLAAADVFLFPSLFEGFGNSQAEAHAAGVPVVIYDAEPMTWLSGPDAALRSRAFEGAGLWQRVASILDSPALAESLGAAGRRRTESFTTDVVAGAMLSLYRAVLSSESTQ